VIGFASTESVFTGEGEGEVTGEGELLFLFCVCESGGTHAEVIKTTLTIAIQMEILIR
jgi:hypothetical protein